MSKSRYGIMRSLIIVISLLVSRASIAGDIDSFFSEADTFLKKYVNGGNVAYEKIKINKTDIEFLYKKLGSLKLENKSTNTLKAFYSNAYNLIVIRSIVEKYPVTSPMDIEGFFDKRKHNVAGEPLTLNELEKNKLLKPYHDARFHFALVCAAKSCPPLSNRAFTSENIEKQLTVRTVLTVNDSDWLRVNTVTKKVELSKIFEWYNSDFASDDRSVVDWINKYRKVKISKSNTISYYEYDWSLNE